MTKKPQLNCCCSTPETEDFGSIRDIRAEDVPPDVTAIRAAGFGLLLDKGEPVNVSRLAAAAGLSARRVEEALASASDRGRVEFDDDGQLLGIAGLTITPGRHEIGLKNETRWTWCALDAVGILGAIDATGIVRSTDPQTGEVIEIAFVDGKPKTDAHLFILGGFSDGDVRRDWCPQVNFFATHDAAEKWASSQKREGDVVSVTEIAAEAAEMWLPVVDTHSDGPASPSKA